MSPIMRAHGTSYGAIYASPPSSAAALTITQLPCPRAEPEKIARDLADAASSAGHKAESLSLPAGPFALTITHRPIQANPERSAQGEPGAIYGNPMPDTMSVFSGFLPLPACQQILAFTVSTPTVPGWEAFGLMTADILATVRIGEP